ncbi:MAG: hypothetical protein MUC79_02155 [Thiobacillaceae bacterium]|jgi:hypothetical protein|nr:hypothetical protein [Thiobacillaceae bacterium]
MDTHIKTGQTFKARSGFTLRIEHVEPVSAAVVATYPDGHRETVLIALEEWPIIVEREGLMPAGLAV